MAPYFAKFAALAAIVLPFVLGAPTSTHHAKIVNRDVVDNIIADR